jgi:hypothetical protein
MNSVLTHEVPKRKFSLMKGVDGLHKFAGGYFWPVMVR